MGAIFTILIAILSASAITAEESGDCRKLTAELANDVSRLAELITEREQALGQQDVFVADMLHEEMNSLEASLLKWGIREEELKHHLRKLVLQSPSPAKVRRDEPNASGGILSDNREEEKLELARRAVTRVNALFSSDFTFTWLNQLLESPSAEYKDVLKGMIYAMNRRDLPTMPKFNHPTLVLKILLGNYEVPWTNIFLGVATLNDLDLVHEFLELTKQPMDRVLVHRLIRENRPDLNPIIEDLLIHHPELIPSEPYQFVPSHQLKLLERNFELPSLAVRHNNAGLISVFARLGMKMSEDLLRTAIDAQKIECAAALVAGGAPEKIFVEEVIIRDMRNRQISNLEKAKKHGFSFRGRPLLTKLVSEILPEIFPPRKWPFRGHKVGDQIIQPGKFQEALESSEGPLLDQWRDLYSFLKNEGAT